MLKKLLSMFLSVALVASFNPGLAIADDSTSARPPATTLSAANQLQTQSKYADEVAQFVDAEVGDVVKFGEYEQDGDDGDGKEPIEWQVLSIDDDQALLVSVFGLDFSKAPSWLNGEFYQGAFNETEQSMICEMDFDEDRDGNGDKVFRLDFDQAMYLFDDDEARICRPTPYLMSLRSDSRDDSACWWFTRTSSKDLDYSSLYTSYVTASGTLETVGPSAVKWLNVEYGCSRPAITVDLRVRDTWGFTNFGHRITLEECKAVFGEMFGDGIYNGHTGDGGLCYGMAAAAGIVCLAQQPPVDAFASGSGTSARYLCEIDDLVGPYFQTEWMLEPADVSALTYIDYMHLLQSDYYVSQEIDRNTGRIEDLAEAVRTGASDGKPVVLYLVKAKLMKHAILALDVASDSEEGTAISVYDPNYPCEIRTLHLLKDIPGKYNGKYSYERESGEIWGDGLLYSLSWSSPLDAVDRIFSIGALEKDVFKDTFIRPFFDDSRKAEYHDKYIAFADKNASLLYGSEHYMLAPGVSNDSEKFFEVAASNGDGSAGDANLYWSDLGPSVSMTTQEDDSRIGYYGADAAIKADVERAGSTVDFAVHDSDDLEATLRQANGGEYGFELLRGSDSTQAGQPSTISISGTGSETVDVSLKGSEISISGVTSITTTDESGNARTEKGLDAAETYTVPADDMQHGPESGSGDGEAPAKASVSDAVVGNAVYTGEQIKPEVSLGSKALAEGDDYTISYKDASGSAIGAADVVAAGDYQAVIIGKGDYTGTATKAFTVARASLDALRTADRTYTGKALEPTVKLGDRTLRSGVDYSVSYSNAKGEAVAAGNVKAAGKYTVDIAGKGNYTGNVTRAFTIAKAKNALKASAKKKAVAVKAKDLKSKKKAVANIKVSKANGKVAYKNVSEKKAAKKLKVSGKGKVTVPKNAKKGAYSVKIRVSAKGDANHKAGSKTVAFTIKVR